MQDKLLIQTLKGIVTDRAPFWFMRQAGRYLPEYRELREKKGGFLDMVYSPADAAEVTVQPLRRFGMDAAILFSDILVIPHALGQDVDFVSGKGPQLAPIRSAEDLKRLSFQNFSSVLNPVYETVERLQTIIKADFPETAVIGFADGPWTVACYMIEGGGSKEFLEIKKFMLGEPDLFDRLMNMLVESTTEYLSNQIKSGAEVVQIFDSWAGLLDETMFKRYVIKPTAKIVSALKEIHPDISVIGFPRLSGANYLSYIQDTNINAVGLDTTVPTSWAARVLQPHMPVQGNLDPAYLLAGGDSMILAAEKIIGDLRQGSHVFNLGHGINKETPIAHVEKLCDYLRG